MFARRQFRWKRWLPSFVDCTQKAHKEENRRLARRLSDLQSKFRLVMASSATTSATATSVSTTSAAADRTAAAAVEAASTSTTMESATAGSAVESTAGRAAVESSAGRAAVKGCSSNRGSYRESRMSHGSRRRCDFEMQPHWQRACC